MIIKPDTNDYEHIDDDQEDFEEVKENSAKMRPEEPKRPTLTPDNPDYWEEPEGQFEHLQPLRQRRFLIWLLVGGLTLGLLIAIFLRLFTPYSEGTVQYGYVESIQRRGETFKTFEGTLLPYRSIADTIEPYEGDLHFSVADDHLAATLLRLQIANLPARIQYDTYRSTLPWRGESKIVITKVDTADVTKIFPPTSGRSTIPAVE